MADFADVVNELKETNKKLDNLTKVSDPKGAAAAEDKRDAANAAARSEGYLKTIADAVGGAGAGPSGKEDKKTGGIFAGISRALGGLGKGVGSAVGGFMKGIATFGAGAVGFIKAMGILGGGLAAFAVAIGAATWVVSKMMPDIANGLKEFDGVDGSNLVNVGAGIGALGAGFATMGAGGAILGVGNLVGSIADGLTGLFGGKDSKTALIDNLKEFSKLKLNVKNIKDNSEAMVAYGIAMTAGGAGSMMNSLATLTDGAIGGLGRLLGGVPVLTQLVEFSRADIDGVKVKKNADAMVAYATSMTVGAGATAMKSVAGVFTMITSFTDGVSKLLGGKGVLDTQLDDMKKLSAAADSIDATKVTSVAGAMIAYAGAMTVGIGATAMKSVAGVFSMITSFTDGVSKLLGGEGVLDTQLKSLKKISAAEGIDAAKIKLVAGAMVAYAEAMTIGAGATAMKSVGGVFNMITSFTDGVSKFFGGEGVLDTQLKSLQKISAAGGIDGAKIKLVAAAMIDYADAMASGIKGEAGKAGAGLGTFVGNAVDGLTSFITGGKTKSSIDSMLEGLRKLSAAKDIDGAVVKRNAEAMVDYAKAMGAGALATGAKEIGDIAVLASGVVKGLSSFFGIAEADPLGDLKKFASTIITEKEIAQIKLNALGITAYADAMVKMGTLQVGKTFGEALSAVFSGIGSLFGGSAEKSPMTALKNFASANIDAEKIKKDISTLLSILEDKNVNLEKSILFKNILTNIGDGLREFTKPGSFVDSLSGAASKVLSFLTGDKSPIQQIETIAGKSKELREGAGAITSISDGLDKMAALKFDGSDINVEDFAEDLMKSVPALEVAIAGGEVGGGWVTSGTKIKGLANPDVGWTEAAANINLLRQAMGMKTEKPGSAAVQGAATEIGKLTVNTLVAEKLISRAVEKSAAGQGESLTVSDQSFKQTTDARSYQSVFETREYSGSASQRQLAAAMPS